MEKYPNRKTWYDWWMAIRMKLAGLTGNRKTSIVIGYKRINSVLEFITKKLLGIP